MKFNNLAYFELIKNMTGYEIDIFNYARDIICAESSRKYELSTMYYYEACGYIRALFFNDLIDFDTFSLFTDYVNSNRYNYD